MLNRTSAVMAILATVGSAAAMAATLAQPAPVARPPVAPMSLAVAPNSASLHGDYVEARTASVFAGACHYNGELVTTGHDAIMGWTITAGAWKGVDLAGVKAMAAVSSDANLGDATGSRRCELVIDSAASAGQAAAFADWIATRHSTLGRVVAIRRAAVQFRHEGSAYNVQSPDFAELSVQSMPNNECCKQPNLVWYTPLQPLEHRKVGYTVTASYTAATLADPWERADENSAFYGTFTD